MRIDEPQFDGYHTLLNAVIAGKLEGCYFFYWPVAPGESWYPNFRRVEVIGEERGPNASGWLPGDMLFAIVRPIPGGYRVSLMGSDDHSLATGWTDPLSLSELKRFLFDLPMPLSTEYIDLLWRNGHPTFFME